MAVNDEMEPQPGSTWTTRIPAERLDCAQSLLTRFGADEKHADRVAARACTLFMWLIQAGLLPDSAERRLESLLLGCLLHDVGQVIADRAHHRHGQYILAHSEATASWPQPLRDDVSTLALAHRKPLGRRRVAEVVGDDWELLRIVAILRIADGLDRARDPLVTLASAQVHRRRFTLIAAGLSDPDRDHVLRKKADVWPIAFDGQAFSLNNRSSP